MIFDDTKLVDQVPRKIKARKNALAPRSECVGPDSRPTAYTGLMASTGFTVLDLVMLFTTWTAVRMILADTANTGAG
jgi:hypothetical protein